MLNPEFLRFLRFPRAMTQIAEGYYNTNIYFSCRYTCLNARLQLIRFHIYNYGSHSRADDSLR